jgi:hypothetical protein
VIDCDNIRNIGGARDGVKIGQAIRVPVEEGQGRALPGE